MYFRLWYGVTLWLMCLGLAGCFPRSEGQSDEQKDEYFAIGKERAAAMDYKGAIEAFEKAAERNPRSALAHFELAVLYEQYSDRRESDYVCAMYHYLQAIRLRPHEYPAENARQRINACKQELVKAESLAPVAQGLFRELDRLKEENQTMRKQLETIKAPPPTPAPTPRSAATGAPNVAPGSSLIGRSAGSRTAPASQVGGRVTPLPPTSPRTHIVRARETAFAIAKQYNVKMDALLAANPSVNPMRLKAGQILNIPSS